jgi:hypothetical protein
MSNPASPLDTPGYQLTDDDLTYLRRILVRDEFVAGQGTTPASALSRFNQTSRKNFFEDEDFQLIADRIIGDQLEELDAAFYDKYSERSYLGDSGSAALTTAGKTQNLCLLYLIAAECMEVEIRDPAYRTAIAVGETALGVEYLMKQMESDAEGMRKWVRSREAEYQMINLERK